MKVLKMDTHKFSLLTERQYDVLQLVAEGLTNSEIGDKLFISCRTVEGIRADLLRITRTKNTAALITHCFRSGILV
ncbi:LuxR C-terminal-related transcriptional regulator [Pedobacter agri]|uniref:LuxR C-terminal-related transcriptional regulator n=1 Tax=Pedobacter agri TaxID=454586 RepID=UPI0029311506|nr:LuxR C-terminal-related transcriptional regulator [Pedobacter agri]